MNNFELINDLLKVKTTWEKIGLLSDLQYPDQLYLSQLLENGIECPECGEELLDSRPNLVLTSSPPKLGIHCEKCNYKGTRIK